MECILELNWLGKHMKMVRSSRPAILILNWIKQFFPESIVKKKICLVNFVESNMQLCKLKSYFPVTMQSYFPVTQKKTTLKKLRLIRVKESSLIKRDQPKLNKTIKSFPLKLFDWDICQ